MEFISIKEAAKRWGLTERMVRGYCNEKRIEGVIFENRTWLIPEDAEKPQRRTTKPPKNAIGVALDTEDQTYEDKFKREKKWLCLL